MKVRRTTLPLRSPSASGAPFCVVRLRAGAAPIRGRPDGCPGRTLLSKPLGTAKPRASTNVRIPTIASGSSVVHERARLAIIVSSPRSRLQLLLQLVQEAPVGALLDDGVRALLDHAGLVETQGIE